MLAESLSLAFKNAGIPEMTMPVKNTFINFDEPRLVGQLRSASCPPFFPSASGLTDAASWERANQVLCHAMAPKIELTGKRTPGERSDSMTTDETLSGADLATTDENLTSVSSEFVTPASSPRCFCSVASGTPRRSEADSVGSAEWTSVQARRPKKGQRMAQSQEARDRATNLPPAWIEKGQHFTNHEVGIEDDSHFFAVRRLLGPTGENLQHIIQESQGAKVWICGKGSGRKRQSEQDSGPLLICISATSKASLQKASALVQDLLQTTHEEHKRFVLRRSSTRSPAAPRITSTRSCRFNVGIQEDSAFQVVKRLVGKNGKNVKRIEAECGASVQLCGRRSVKQDESEGPLQVLVSASTQSNFDAAAAAVMAALTRVHADYRAFCRLNGQTPPLLTVICEDEYSR